MSFLTASRASSKLRQETSCMDQKPLGQFKKILPSAAHRIAIEALSRRDTRATELNRRVVAGAVLDALILHKESAVAELSHQCRLAKKSAIGSRWCLMLGASGLVISFAYT
jgi:hypothetical protein